MDSPSPDYSATQLVSWRELWRLLLSPYPDKDTDEPARRADTTTDDTEQERPASE
jgi:hypothetical protein